MSTSPHIEIVPLQQVPGEKFENSAAKRRIALVVDDERVIADTLSVILTHNGFQTMTAYDGAGALKLAEVTRPDLLLSDVMMGPGIDGTELAIEIVRRYPECKVLLFSGHSATRELLEKANDAGYNFTLLTKPLHPADLLARLEQTFLAEMAA